jgi:hypothetical protein
MPMIIEQLSARQVARHAFNVFLFSGRHQTGAKLVYHAVRLDPKDAEALRCLSDLLDAKGTEIFSGIVLEYALSESTGIAGEARKVLDDLRFLAKWSWGFARHRSGSPHLAGDAFKDRTAFVVEEDRYQEFLAQVVKPAGSLPNAFKAAHTLCGAMAGFLAHRELGRTADIGESLHPDRFTETPAYREWLKTSTDELDALEAARQAKAGSKKTQ